MKGHVVFPSSGHALATVHQVNHGFSVGMAIRHNENIYVKAQADNDENAQVCGIVSKVIDMDNFRMVEGGYIQGDWIPGKEYILSPYEAGKIMVLPDPEVWEVGQVRLSLGWGTTLGLKVEIDVGDVIGSFNFPTAELKGYWDREFEFCINAGISETFDVDLWAVYEYDIIEAILEVDGTLNGVAIKIGGIDVGGLNNITVGSIAKSIASSANSVAEGNRVTLVTPVSYSGNPTIIKGKLKILRA